jgi:hypothetical protein
LLAEYLVTQFAKVEQTKLDFIRRRQLQIRTELAKGIEDALRPADVDGLCSVPIDHDSSAEHTQNTTQQPASTTRSLTVPGAAGPSNPKPWLLPGHQVGHPITVLSASYVGGPRYNKANYLDAMALLPVHHHPDLFITMTSNPK